ncbi:MAG: hypothetical protein II295_06830 [Akkermansia sp.]|nr:hypothetical protein [Akkermansia sp.]
MNRNTHHTAQEPLADEDATTTTTATAPAPATDGAGATPPTVPPTAPPPLMGDDGEFAPEWYKQFEELQPYAATLGKFRRPEALAKSYAMLERMKGYPAVDDTRRMAAFRSAVGLPEQAADYAIQRPDNTPDELWDPALAAALSAVAYEYGVPPLAMGALCETYSAEGRRMLAASHEAQAAAIAHADAELQQDWGRNYDDNMRTVGSFLTQLGSRAGVDVAELAANPALRANADFARLMLAAASLLEEAPLHTGAPTDSREEARRIAGDPSHPLHEAYMRTSHPRHRYANEQYDRLAFGHPL